MSHFPPIDLFDDIADPRDWEALAMAQSRTNPRIYEEVGDLSLVPIDRRISGDGASWVMAAFTHISIDRASRFSDGTYGAYYAANSLETAFYEHAFHVGRFYASTNLEKGWLSEVKQLVGSIDKPMIDLREGDFKELLDPDIGTYPKSQSFAAKERNNGVNGIVYPSLRHSTGECFAAFHPDVVTPPKQASHFRYHWNGTYVDYVQKLSGNRAIFELRWASAAL